MRCYYLHRSRDLVSPVCGIFLALFGVKFIFLDFFGDIHLFTSFKSTISTLLIQCNTHPMNRLRQAKPLNMSKPDSQPGTSTVARRPCHQRVETVDLASLDSLGEELQEEVDSDVYDMAFAALRWT